MAISRKTYIGSFIMVTVAMALWGISFIWTKQLIGIISGTVLIFLRMIIASILLLSIGFVTKSINSIKKRDIKEFLLLALVQPFLYFNFEIESIKSSSPTVISLIIAQIPLFVAITSFVVSKRRVPINVLIGIVVSIVGVCIVMLGGEDVSLMTTPYGIVMGLGAMLCAVCYIFLTKRLVEKYNPFTVTTFIHVAALLYFLPMVLIFERDGLNNIPLTVNTLYPLLSLGVLCSAVAFMMYSYGIKNLGVITSSMVNNLSPAVTAVAVFFMMGDSLSLFQISGIIVSIIGLTIGLLKRK